MKQLSLVALARMLPALASILLLFILSLKFTAAEAAPVVLWFSLVSLISVSAKCAYELAIYRAIANAAGEGLVWRHSAALASVVCGVAGMAWLCSPARFEADAVFMGVACAFLLALVWIFVSLSNAKNRTYGHICIAWLGLYLPLGGLLLSTDSISLEAFSGTYFLGLLFALLVLTLSWRKQVGPVAMQGAKVATSNEHLRGFFDFAYFVSGLLNQAVPWLIQSGVTLYFDDSEYIEFTVMFRVLQISAFILLPLVFMAQRSLSASDLSSLQQGYSLFLRQNRHSLVLAIGVAAVTVLLATALLAEGYSTIGVNQLPLLPFYLLGLLAAITVATGPINIFLNLHGMTGRVIRLRIIHVCTFLAALHLSLLDTPLQTVLFYSVTNIGLRLILIGSFRAAALRQSDV